MIEFLVAICTAFLLDLTFGDPKNKLHPTAWLGALIAKLVPTTRGSPTFEKFAGMYVIMLPVIIVISLLFLLEMTFGLMPLGIVSVVLSAFIVGILLKTTLAIRGMERHALAVVAAVETGDIFSAREHLSMIVKRDTSGLNQDHIYSGVVESIGENTVDGITGPLFYFGFFGIFGAFVYRIVNTADSMVGYNNNIFKNIGWFAATCDRVLNYIPSRLTGMIMILSSMILRNNWKKSYQILIRDCRNTQSPNAGYPMAAMAGALETKLEKIDHYSIGDGTVSFSKEHVLSAISLMKVTSILFGVIVTIPVVIIMYYLGWWIHV